MFNNSTILITGGTGSFGLKYTEIILEKFQPKKIIHVKIFSQNVVSIKREIFGVFKQRKNLKNQNM